MKLEKILKQYNVLSDKEFLLTHKVSSYYSEKLNEEISKIGFNGPLFRTSCPTKERLELHAPFEVPDFVTDKNNMPQGLEHILIQKYDNRVLIISTDECVGHCQYCFRTRLLSEEKKLQANTILTADKVDKIIQYLKTKPRVSEVIFSGGDPLTIPFENLRLAIMRIIGETSVKNIRVHTRAIVYSPTVFTVEKINFFSQYNVRIVFHINHPYEIFPEVLSKIKEINKAGVRTYNQFPILRKINDHPKVIIKLLELLDSLGTRTLSVYIPDPINFSASFRMPLERIFSIFDDINWHSSSWINSIRVVLDSPIGKVRRENISKWDTNNGVVVFSRDNDEVIYHDFPKNMDEPGELKYLLWKGDCGD